MNLLGLEFVAPVGDLFVVDDWHGVFYSGERPQAQRHAEAARALPTGGKAEAV